MDKIEEVVESKTEEITVKLDEVLDKVEEIKVEEPKIVQDIIDKLDDIPVINDAMQNIVDVVDGRTFTCFCSVWKLTLNISRKTPKTSPSKSEETPNKESVKPAQDTLQEVKLPPTSPPEDQKSPVETS